LELSVVRICEVEGEIAVHMLAAILIFIVFLFISRASLKKMVFRRKGSISPEDQFVLFGLDGGTWDIIEPLIAKGELPSMEKLIRSGSYGDLMAECPYSPPSWATIATGVNADKHGFSHFTVHLAGRPERVVLNYGMVNTPNVWGLIESEGRRVGVFKWVSVPQYPGNLVKKKERYIVLSTMGIGFVINKIRLKLRKYFRSPYNPEDCFLRQSTLPDLEISILEYLLKRKDPHFLTYRFASSDSCSHWFWKHEFPEGYEVDRGDLRRYGRAVTAAYRRADKFIGKLLKEKVNVMVVSDHGFRGYSRDETHPLSLLFNINYGKLLNRMGFLEFKEDGKSIDWERTKVYWCGDPRVFAEFAVNLKGREPNGAVPPEDYENVKEDLKRALESIRFKDTGERLFSKLTLHNGTPYNKYVISDFLGEEAQFWNNNAFDLLIEDLYKCRFQDDSVMDRAILIGSNGFKLGEFLKPNYWSANHCRRGVFMAAGKNIRPGRIGPISTLDIAPNILYWMDLPVLPSMEGKVQAQIFNDEFVKRHPVKFFSDQAYASKSEDISLTKRQEARIKEDLENLGYL